MRCLSSLRQAASKAIQRTWAGALASKAATSESKIANAATPGGTSGATSSSGDIIELLESKLAEAQHQLQQYKIQEVQKEVKAIRFWGLTILGAYGTAGLFMADQLITLRSELHNGLKELRSELHNGLKEVRSELHSGFMEIYKRLPEVAGSQAVMKQEAADVGGIDAKLDAAVEK